MKDSHHDLPANDTLPSNMSSETKYIRVVAPATLEAGFIFDVLVDGEPFSVVVPEGGVTEGEEFEVPYQPQSPRTGGHLPPPIPSNLDDNNNNNPQDDAPRGQFRVSLCSCCDVVTQATFWMGLCCLPVLLAQVMTRLRLTWNGQAIPHRHKELGKDDDEELTTSDRRIRSTDYEAVMTFNKIVLAFLVALAFGHIPLVGSLFVIIFYFFMVVWVGGNLRRHFRQRYNIPSKAKCLPTRVVDCCTMCWCGCCAVIQMARHTHDDKDYPGACCTTTGLEEECHA